MDTVKSEEKWYQHQVVNMDGVTSGDNEYRMQALNNVEQGIGFNSLIWDLPAVGHGIGAAITGLERGGNPEKQETWVIQTDPYEEQQIVPWHESVYSTGDGDEQHPAYMKEPSKWLYVSTAIGINDQKGEYSVDREMLREFEEFYENPETRNAYELLDPMTACAHIIYQNPNVTVNLSKDSMELS